jgi:RNA polymerase sigma-70 factor (ECF subfamily)
MRCSRSDEQLIEQFVTGTRDDADEAFGLLVNRHGPMVMGVGRQILGRHQDAEDAFQATFLTLARKASTIRNRRVLGYWLYEVAHRIAIRMRARARRQTSLQDMDWREESSGEPEGAAFRNELRLHLFAELDSLPETYRFLVVQCYLEGKTNRELARLLDRPIGTIKGWLSRARGILRERLSGTDLGPDALGDRTIAACSGSTESAGRAGPRGGSRRCQGPGRRRVDALAAGAAQSAEECSCSQSMRGRTFSGTSRSEKTRLCRRP